MKDRVDSDIFVLARKVLCLTFVILSAVGFAVSALLIALAYAFERLYSVPALPWALSTLALPTCGLIVLALSTRLARFISGHDLVSGALRSAFVRGRPAMTPANHVLQRPGDGAHHGGRARCGRRPLSTMALGGLTCGGEP